MGYDRTNSRNVHINVPNHTDELSIFSAVMMDAITGCCDVKWRILAGRSTFEFYIDATSKDNKYSGISFNATIRRGMMILSRRDGEATAQSTTVYITTKGKEASCTATWRSFAQLAYGRTSFRARGRPSAAPPKAPSGTASLPINRAARSLVIMNMLAENATTAGATVEWSCEGNSQNQACSAKLTAKFATGALVATIESAETSKKSVTPNIVMTSQGSDTNCERKISDTDARINNLFSEMASQLRGPEKDSDEAEPS